MDFLDITRPLKDGMGVYSAPEAFERIQTHEIDRDGYNLSLLRIGAHTGTHIDAPSHFLPGAQAVEDAPLDLLIGRALVAAATEDGLSGVPGGTTRLLLRSGGSAGLDAEQARTLLQKGVRLLGTDRLSVASAYDEAQVHTILLEGGAWLLENLTLDGVADGWYELTCLPLLIPGCEGAPARAILRRVP